MPAASEDDSRRSGQRLRFLLIEVARAMSWHRKVISRSTIRVADVNSGRAALETVRPCLRCDRECQRRRQDDQGSSSRTGARGQRSRLRERRAETRLTADTQALIERVTCFSRRQAFKANDLVTSSGSSQRELRGSTASSPHSNDDAAVALASVTAGSVKP